MDIKVPFLKEEIGAGDVVKAATSAVGVKPCTPCEERRHRMNAGLRFVPREKVKEGERGGKATRVPGNSEYYGRSV